MVEKVKQGGENLKERIRALKVRSKGASKRQNKGHDS